MLNCNVVKDLLPNYIDGLLSEKTVQEIDEHLSSCADCNAAYEEMKTPLAPITIEDVNEVDYLKKVKTKNKIRSIKYAVISALVVAAVFIISIFVFFIGEPVNSEDFSYTLHRLSDNSVQIEMKLENGLVLNAQPETIFEYTDAYGAREEIYISTPMQVYKIPFDDRGEDNGSGFTWGYENDAGIPNNFTFVFRFADKDVVLTIEDFQDK